MSATQWLAEPDALPIRRLRWAAGLTQKEAARRMGMTVRTLRHLEAGDCEPRGEHVRRLAQFYGVSADVILGIADAR